VTLEAAWGTVNALERQRRTDVHNVKIAAVGDLAAARPTWAEIDLSALRRNLGRVRERAGDRRVLAVVKADAYGHGAVEISRTLVQEGCEALAVATLEEARQLREAGIEAPLLLLSGLHAPEQADTALSQDLVPALGRLDALEPLEAAAKRAGRDFPLHLNVDTGMTRLGLALEEVAPALERIARAKRLECVGLMSHLADADDRDAASLRRQRERFAALVAQVRDAGYAPKWIHLDNSAGLIHGPTPDTSAVRVGLMLYGADPTLEGGHSLDPVMSLCTRAIHAKTVQKGTRVGYGGIFVGQEPTRILTLPVGYADGLPRAAGGAFSVGLRGRRVPLVGRVSMDLATVDAGPAFEGGVGEEILIFGRKKELVIPVEELAAAVGTIAYEILVAVGPRVERVAE
jgi:alanine racemase